MSQNRSVAIIGAGLGGLSLAVRLAAKGYNVTVCEKNERPGGKMNLLEREGFRFDTGPSLVTLLDVFRETFEAVGRSLEDYLTPIRIDPLCQYVFADGTKLEYTISLPEMLATIRNFERQDVEGFLKFMKLGAKIYALSRETFFRQSPFELPPHLNLGVLKHFPVRYGWGNYARTVEAHFRSPHLQQLYNRYPTYVGSSPYKTPATLTVIPFIEFAYGGWFFQGGLYRVIEALQQLGHDLGVNMLTDSRVSEVLHADRKVRGIRLGDGTTIHADVVVMNGDASSMPALLGSGNASSLPPSKRSLSGVVFLVGLRKTMAQLHHHSIYFSDSYREEFHQLFEASRFPEDPTVYVNVASRSDRSLVPPNGETLFIMANAPATDEMVWDKETIERAWKAILLRLKRSGFPDFESSIVFREALTPATLADRFLSPGGAIYGHNSHGWKNTFLRPPNKDLKYKGLYYVGGSSHPGGGTPMVLLSARITSELIERHENS